MSKKLWVLFAVAAVAGVSFLLFRGGTPEFAQTMTPDTAVQDAVVQVVRSGCEAAARNDARALKRITLDLDSTGAREFWDAMTGLPELEWSEASFTSPKTEPEFVYVRISGKDGSRWLFELKNRKGEFKFQACRKLNI